MDAATQNALPSSWPEVLDRVQAVVTDGLLSFETRERAFVEFLATWTDPIDPEAARQRCLERVDEQLQTLHRAGDRAASAVAAADEVLVAGIEELRSWQEAAARTRSRWDAPQASGAR